jgi:hypothetical protein
MINNNMTYGSSSPFPFLRSSLTLPPPLSLLSRSRTGYSNIDNEALFVVPTLWDSVKSFMTPAKLEHPSWFPDGRDEAFVKTEDDKYSLRVYYNNFEIVHRTVCDLSLLLPLSQD